MPSYRALHVKMHFLIHSQHCTLHDFVSDFIKDIFLRHLMAEIDLDLKKATKGEGRKKKNVYFSNIYGITNFLQAKLL